MQRSSIVGFFDILGTSNAVMSDRFSEADALEFVNPIGLAAHDYPMVRFAVFSDSLIVSADPSEIRPLLRAINFMYGNWISELIYVRGAISYGDLHWVDDPPSDTLFRDCSNLIYARIYGKGLVIAHELEQKSGPGAVCFLTGQVAELLRAEEPCSVLESYTPLLCWATERQARAFQGYSQVRLEGTAKDTAEWRHAVATKYYWDVVVSQMRFLPNSYSLEERVDLRT